MKDARRFAFDPPRVPSARQRKYGDRRACPAGKVPDDVWILSPEDAEAEGLFAADADCWHFPRVSGTHRERVNHVCQMPTALLERMIVTSISPGGLVVDPFAGSGSTLVAAKRLGRRWLGVDKSEASVRLARRRSVDAPARVSAGERR